MKILLIVLGCAAVGLILWALYVWIERVNHVGETRYGYSPLNGWNIAATVLCILVAAGGVAISRQHGEWENAFVGIALAVFAFVLLLVRIARKSSVSLALASSVLLLILATVSGLLIATAVAFAWMHITEDEDAKIRRAIRRS